MPAHRLVEGEESAYVAFRLPVSELADIDALATERGETRSRTLRDLLRTSMRDVDSLDESERPDWVQMDSILRDESRPAAKRRWWRRG